MEPSVYLLTGMPGSGKTSLIRQAVQKLDARAGGFYTEEVRKGGIRQGFRIVTLSGLTAVLAHIEISSPFKVSKYGVDIDGLERTGVPALQDAVRNCDVVVVDEIGKMELFSERFKAAVLEIIESDKKVLGTIMLKSDPWADNIKKKPRVKLINVTRSNREQVLKEIQNWLQEYDR